MDFTSKLSSASSSSPLTTENIKWLEKQFRKHVVDGDEIRKEDFNKIIQTKHQFFTERVFKNIDRDSSGSISLQEFLQCIHECQNSDDKIRFLFKVYDVDGDGLIQAAELQQVMTACMEENGMNFSEEQIHKLTMELFEDADVERRGALTCDALKAQLQKHVGLLENLSISIERWLVPPKPPSLKTRIKSWKPHQLSWHYFRNNYVYLLWLAAFLITNIALFLYRIFFWRWRDGEYDSASTDYVVIARAAGQCLNFNCTFIVVLMLRRSLTYLRARGAGSFIPIDRHIYFHMLTGWFVFFLSVLHTVMHLVNINEGIIPQFSHLNLTYWSILFDPVTTSSLSERLKFGLIPGFAFNSGVMIMIILTTMVICSLPFVRRGGCFEVFYWTHLLYVAFWTLLIIHAPNFWKWFLLPGVIFLIEQALRYYYRHLKISRGRAYARSGILHPSKVTQLIIKRPPSFEFAAGDYMFVRIPHIAKYEWHPFTISSSPEQEDVIHFYIRGVGQWTKRLYEYFEEEQKKSLGGNEEETALISKRSSFINRSRSLKVQTAVLSKWSPIPMENANMKNAACEDGTASKSGRSLDLLSSPVTSPASAHNGNVSSVKMTSETDVVVNNEQARILLQKPIFESKKSMPDRQDQLVEGDVRKKPPFLRSFSVNSDGDDNDQNRSFRPLLPSKRSRSPILAGRVRNLRHKPTIVPVNNENLAEEGASPYGNVVVGAERKVSPWSTVTATTGKEIVLSAPLEIYLDGPYGAPSSRIFRAEHAVLIATGIGVTPFASILQSIMMRYIPSRQSCPSCKFAWRDEMPASSVFNLKKVDFLWINRKQQSFEWFVQLLSELEIGQAELGGDMDRFLDMHMYITSALQRTDMKAVGLQLALDLLHDKEKRDLITGLKTRTNTGRPDWDQVFKQFADQNKGKVTVFYCGPPALARTLKIKCDEFNFIFRKECF